MQNSSRRSYYSWPASNLLPVLMEWNNSQMYHLAVLFFRCVVLSPFPSQIAMVSAAHWVTSKPRFSAQRWSCRVCIWIVFTSATSHISNPKLSHIIFGSQQWSMIEWWISSAWFSKQVSVVFIISSRLMQYSSRCEKAVSQVLEIVPRLGKQGEYIWGLRGVILIWRYHFGRYWGRKCFA